MYSLRENLRVRRHEKKRKEMACLRRCFRLLHVGVIDEAVREPEFECFVRPLAEVERLDVRDAHVLHSGREIFHEHLVTSLLILRLDQSLHARTHIEILVVSTTQSGGRRGVRISTLQFSTVQYRCDSLDRVGPAVGVRYPNVGEESFAIGRIGEAVVEDAVDLVRPEPNELPAGRLRVFGQRVGQEEADALKRREGELTLPDIQYSITRSDLRDACVWTSELLDRCMRKWFTFIHTPGIHARGRAG